MNDKISVSVIVPVFNVEKYLSRCLNSLINQTLSNIEIICINDGSTDNSLNILNEYAQKDSRIIVINQENSGQSYSRNKGLDIAKGEFIGFVDSDDWVDLDFFENLYNSAKDNECDIAVAGIIRLHKWHKKCHLKINKLHVTRDVNEKFSLCDVPNLSYIWNKIYKKSVLDKYHFRFIEGMIYEDVILTPQLLYYMDSLVTVPKTNYYYWRRFNSTVTQKNEKAIKDAEKANKLAEQFIKEKNISIQKEETYRFKIFGFTVFKIRKQRNNIQYILFNIIKVKVNN